MYNDSAWALPVTFKNHTPGDRAPLCPLGGQRGMIGVEEKQKEKL